MGVSDGEVDGLELGTDDVDGVFDGFELGIGEDGVALGKFEGTFDGMLLGFDEGSADGRPLGLNEVSKDGSLLGRNDGCELGLAEDGSLGDVVG